MWVSRITAFAAVCNLLVSYSSYFITSVVDGFNRYVFITTVVILLSAINLIEVKNSALFSNIFAIGKLIPIILFIVVGLFFIDLQNFNFKNFPPIVSFSEAIVILLFAFSGFEVATINAGEVQEPRKYFPRMLIFVLLIVIFIYSLIQIVTIGTLPNLATSVIPLADSANIFLGGAGTSIITVGALISMIGSLNVTMLGCTRIPFALAESGQWPSLFSRIHSRFKTPHLSVLVSGILILIASLSYSFLTAVKINVLIKLITYALVCLSLPILRRKSSEFPELFRLPGGIIISILALILCIWLLFRSSGEELIQLSVIAFAGLVIYFLFKKSQARSL
jgi:amino acid transporter